jgi:hypothetical protein
MPSRTQLLHDLTEFVSASTRRDLDEVGREKRATKGGKSWTATSLIRARDSVSPSEGRPSTRRVIDASRDDALHASP